MAGESNPESNAPVGEFAEGLKSIFSRGANAAGSSSPPATALQSRLRQVCRNLPSGNSSTSSRRGAMQTTRLSCLGSSSASSDSSGYVTSKDKGRGLTTASSIDINSLPDRVSPRHPYSMDRSGNVNPLAVIGQKRGGGQELRSNSPGPSMTRCLLAANGVIGKAPSKAPKPKRKPRPSKKPPTQVIKVSKEEFRPTVQRITGCRLPEAQLGRPQPERQHPELPPTERRQLERPQPERQQPERLQSERKEPELPKPERRQLSKQAKREEPERPEANLVAISGGVVANPPPRTKSSSMSRIQAVPSASPIVSSRVPEPTGPFDSDGSASSSSLLQYTLCDNESSIYKAFGFPEGHKGILDDDLEQASDDGYSGKPVHDDGASPSTPTAEVRFKALSVVDDVDRKEDVQREHRVSAMPMPASSSRPIFPMELNDVPNYEMERIFDFHESFYYDCGYGIDYGDRFLNSGPFHGQ